MIGVRTATFSIASLLQNLLRAWSACVAERSDRHLKLLVRGIVRRQSNVMLPARLGQPSSMFNSIAALD